MKSPLLLALALAALLTAPAFAQETNGITSATLRIDSGSAMVSTGGEFSTAPSGVRVPSGSRVMLPEGSRATLVYSNGCTQALNNAGVYNVSATCVAALPQGSTAAAGADLGGAAIISGLAVAGAAALASMDDVEAVPPPPVSR